MSATMLFNNLITFSRGTSATLTGPTGLIQWAPMNLLTYSEQFDNAAWTKNNVTITANSTTAPDGTMTADTLDEGTATANHAMFSGAATLVSGLNYAASIYLKAGSARWVQIPLLNATFGSNAWANFDLVGGAVGNTGSAVVSATITSAGNGWYRCVVVAPATASGSGASLQVGFTDNANSATRLPSYTGSSKTVFAWGAQLELGTTATTYNSTTVKNLLGYSEAFDNAAWTKSNASIVTGAAANPVNGLFNASKLMEDTSTAGHQANQAVTTTAAPFTFSVNIKAAGRNWAALGITDSGSTVRVSYFDLANGVVGTVATGITASMLSLGNGWYRCSVTVAAALAGSNTCRIYLSTANNVTSYTGDGNSGIYIWGAQLSDSGSLDPYVPTPGAAPTSAAYYGPRFDYDPVTLAAKGLLIEEARTNRTLYSEDFTGAAWAATVSGTSTRVNDGSPRGFTLGLVTATSASGGIRQTHSGLTGGQVYALSFYIQSTATSVLLTFENGAAAFGSSHSVTINPSAGTAGALTGFTSVLIQPFGTGYIYTLITAAAGGGLIANIEWRITTNGDSIRLGRPQFEAGAFATSYIPTVASTATRSADVATMTGTNFAPWYNQSAGTFVVGADSAVPASGLTVYTVAVASDGTGSNMNRVFVYSGSWGGNTVTAGAVQSDLQKTASFTPATIKASAYAYAANDFAFTAGGASVITDTVGSLPTLTQFGIGGSPGAQLNGHIRSVTYYPDRLSNTQLQSLTT